MIETEVIPSVEIPNHTFKPEPFQMSNASLGLKRFIDVSLSLLFLLPFLVILLPLAILIKLDSKGSVFFTQFRTGKDERQFVCIKFRTMKSSNLDDVSEDDSKRITRFGMYLRKAHIDELPQLINVLKGDMSLVGPRPHMESDTLKFEKLIDTYHDRHLVKPGITGLAQVKGFYGWVDDEAHLIERVNYDREYIRKRSLALDLKILVKTFAIPFKFQG